MVLNKLGLTTKETYRKVPYELPKGIFDESSNRDSWLEIVRRLVVENIQNKKFIQDGFIEMDRAFFESKDVDVINIQNTLKFMKIDSPFCKRKAYLAQLEIEDGDLKLRKEDKNHTDLDSCMVYLMTFCNLDYAGKEVLDYLSEIAKEKKKELNDQEKKEAMEQYLNDSERDYPRTPVFIKAPKTLMEQMLNAAKWVINNVKGEDGKPKYIYQKFQISTNDLIVILIGGSIYNTKTKDRTSSYQNCWVDDVLPVLP